MQTPTERQLRATLRAERAITRMELTVSANWSLRTGLSVGAIAIARAMADPQAERAAGWVRVNHAQVAVASALSCERLRLLVRAMAGDCLIERYEPPAVATSQGYRKAVYLRSLVGPTRLELLAALACWTPDWSVYVRCQAARPPRAHRCPHCGATGVQIVTSCLGCGVVLDERTAQVDAPPNGDGEPPGG